MKRFFTVLAAFLLTAIVFAQSPEKMSYQAVIRNSSNALVTNTMIGMQISILQGSASGTAVYVETQTPTTNANGLVSIEIGAGTVEIGDFTTIDWANGPYFIKTETDPTGGTSYSITGTSQILSVPYALHAKTAERVSGGITETDPVFTAWGKDYNELNNKPALFNGQYNSLTGTPALTAVATSGNYNDLANKPTTLAGYSITDAMSTSHAAAGITAINISNWNTAYGWGNHATQGYLKTYTETDPVFGASVASGITTTDTTNWSHKFDLPSLSTGSVLFSNGTTIAEDNNKLFWDNTNKCLGIGTNMPLASLEVKSQNPALSGSILRIINKSNDSVLTISGKGANVFIDSAVGSFNIGLQGGLPPKRLLTITPLNYFIGYESGKSITTGNYNFFAGYEAGKNCMDGSQNIFVGTSAGSAFTSGADNICIGYQAAYSNNTGNNNTILGYQAGYSSSGSRNVFVGYQAGYNEFGSDKLYIHNSSTNSPLIYGDFSSKALKINGNMGVNYNGVTGYGLIVETPASQSEIYALYVMGNAYATGNWNSSDERYKTNIEPVQNALQNIVKLNGVTYNWNRDKFPEKGFGKSKQIGLIAQEVEIIYPEMVKADEQGYKAINYSAFVPLLIESIKEQQKKIESLELLNDKVKQLEEQNKKLVNDLGLIKEQLKMNSN